MRKKTFAAAAPARRRLPDPDRLRRGADSDAPVTVVSEDTGQQAATVLDKPFEKPDLVLTDTQGKEYDLRERTAGKPTLIYFGYTHCPDVCPLTMNNVAVAKKQLSQAERDKLQIVFVTTDPERDTPAALGKWLKGIDPQIVGLTGEFDTIQAGARTLGISIDPPTKDKDGKVVSTHGTQVVAFSPEIRRRLRPLRRGRHRRGLHQGPPQARQGGEPVTGRPTLAAVTMIGALVLAGCGDSGSGSDSSAAGAELSVGAATIPQPVSDSMAAGFLTITNKGDAEDELTSVTSEAGDVTVHETVDGTMKEVDRLPIPAHGRLVFKSGGNHLMFEKLKQQLKQGQTVSVELHFAHSGPVTVKLPVKAATYQPTTGPPDTEGGTTLTQTIAPRVRTLVLLLLAAACALLAGAGPASAHAALTGSDPGQGTVVDKAPAQVSLTFSESVSMDDDSLRVLDPKGERVDDGRPSGTGGTKYTVKLHAGLPGRHVHGDLPGRLRRQPSRRRRLHLLHRRPVRDLRLRLRPGGGRRGRRLAVRPRTVRVVRRVHRAGGRRRLRPRLLAARLRRPGRAAARGLRMARADLRHPRTAPAARLLHRFREARRRLRPEPARRGAADQDRRRAGLPAAAPRRPRCSSPYSSAPTTSGRTRRNGT